MSRIWRQQSYEILQSWIDAILEEASDKLTDWESVFIEDMQVKILNRWALTQRQEEILERIYAEKTS